MESAGRRTQARGLKPVPRSGHVAVTYGGLMLVWGGYTDLPALSSESHWGDQYLDGSELWCYDIEASLWDVWSTRKSPPGMSGSCAACIGRHMYVFGGYSADGNSNKLYRLDLKTKVWMHLKPNGKAPSPRDKVACWPYRDKLVFFGGFGPPPDNEDVTMDGVGQWRIDLSSLNVWSPTRGWNNHLVVYNITENSWTHVQIKGYQPCPRAAHAAAVIGNKGYLFGGRFEGSRMNDLHVLNLDTLQWVESLNPVSGDIPMGRSWHCMAPVSDRHLLVYGGYSTEGVPLNDVWVLDVENKTWHQQDSLPSDTRIWHTAVSGVDAGEVVVFGGCSNDLLDPYERSVHSSKIFKFFFSPKNLKRLCSEAIVTNIAMLEKELNALPSVLQRTIELLLRGCRKGDAKKHGYNLRARPKSS
ncbi:kelch domain-containing protein 2-like [Acanthaster planci]|uniref:Kelch domain-containing protein 2-like n=1 Tax=Acanthaster planci TaxID=133434 RepID=A0A8B7YDM6_ACAPL|nr:kelch domain-containing protein 2-like [Acanthaster planci]XP_022091360.1 kelch domain-containing protein 2-like [Acanthaster planci]